jgi:CubicO group peptidase (beta-lactamase class C family)
MICRTFVFWLAGIFFFHACSSQSAPSVDEEIRAVESGLTLPLVEAEKPLQTYSIFERMDTLNVPGVSVAFVQGGQLKWAKGYGVANTETGSRVDENTLFQAGSISKPIAALAALKLVEEGKISLDEDVNPYLKGWQIPKSPSWSKRK